jgi:Ca2+/Na+ antiporter
MKKRITGYMEYIDRSLQHNDTGLTYQQLLEEHKVQLGFFMHERLVHLLVTLTFAILAFGTFFLMMVQFSMGLLLLFAAILVLLVPYIMHYYLLEEGVQKMYRQYDALHEKVRKEAGGENMRIYVQQERKKIGG